MNGCFYVCTANGTIGVFGATDIFCFFMTKGRNYFCTANLTILCCCASGFLTGFMTKCGFYLDTAFGTFLSFRASSLCTGFMTFCRCQCCMTRRTILCLRASCCFTRRMTLCRLQFDMAYRAGLGIGTARRAWSVTSCRCQFDMANGTFLCVDAVRRRAGLVSDSRCKFDVTYGAVLTFGAVCRLTGRMTLCGNGFLFDQRFLAERAVLTFRQAVLRAGGSDCAVDNGNMVTAVLFFCDHVYAEMIGCEGNISFGYRCGNLFRRVATHIIYDCAVCGDSARQGDGNGNVAFDLDLTSIAPKLHFIKMIGALVDGKLSDCGLGLIVRLNFSNLKFGSKFKSSCFRFHGRVIFGVGKIFNGGILHQIPCEERTDTHDGGNQKCDKTYFQSLFCGRCAITAILGYISDCNLGYFGDFFRACDGVLGGLVVQMSVIIAEDLCLHEQRRNAIIWLICAFIKQIREHFLCFIHLSHFKGVIDLVQLFFK